MTPEKLKGLSDKVLEERRADCECVDWQRPCDLHEEAQLTVDRILDLVGRLDRDDRVRRATARSIRP